jgi:phage terminase large subunit
MLPQTSIQLPNGWSPRPYQLPLWHALEGGCKRAIAAWHRRSGKDSTAINWTAVSAIQRVGLYFHCAPVATQARKIVWDAIDADGRRVIDQAFPKVLRDATNENEMRIRLVNGSVWQLVGSDNYDQLVGTNPVGVTFSEYALADPQAWNFMRPILAENKGWALFISTPRGQNHFADLYEMAKRLPDWFASILTIEDTKAISVEAVERDHAEGMSSSMIRQEYYCSFAGSVEGAYYHEYLDLADKEKRIAHVPWEPALPVHTAWDLGLDDATAIWFFQRHNKEIRLIDYYEASGVGLEHYTRHLQTKPYTYGTHLLPHDVVVKELGSGLSRKEMLKSLGVNATVVPRQHVEDGINAVRAILGQCWFDADKALGGLKALRAYRTEYDSKTGTNKQRPKHDWTSHGSDAFRYLALGLRLLDVRNELAQRAPSRVLRGYEKQKAWIGTGAQPSRRPFSKVDHRPSENLVADIEKLRVGPSGYTIQRHGEAANDGRQRWSVHGPDDAILAFAWGEDDARRAVMDLSSGGKIGSWR